MKAHHSILFASLAIGALSGTTSVVDASAINIDLAPSLQVVNVGDTIDIQLTVSAADLSPQDFDALDAIIGWDTNFLSLVTFDNTGAGASFFITGFLPDPDSINTSLVDGDALFTALATPGSPVSAPTGPAMLIVTTFKFTALAPTAGTDVILIPSLGTFGETRALLNGVDVTRSILGPATVVIVPAPGSFMVLGVAGLVGRRRRRH